MTFRHLTLLAIAALVLVLGAGFLANQRWVVRNLRYEAALVRNSDGGRGLGSLEALSGDALRHRHPEPGHPVEHRAADPGFGLLGRQCPGAQATTDDGLVGNIAVSPSERRP